MNWVPVVLAAILLYALVAGYIRRKHLFEEHVSFYGPVLAIKSSNVGFFDRFTRFSRLLKGYGSFGVLMVIIISFGISILLFFSLQFTLAVRPEPTGIYEPQNILLLPGINEFIPSTFAVWFAFVLTIFIHECGHGILCRVEGIRVRYIGALLAVIPIGFFVEPDEDDLQNTHGMSKARMFGAGITNNLVIGVISLILLIVLFGFATPTSVPLVHGVYKDFPAEFAGVPPDSIILAVDGIPVSTIDDVSSVLQAYRPGDNATFLIEHGGSAGTYTLTLSSWPPELGQRDSGFMGIYYYNGSAVKELIGSLGNPIGLLRLLTVPFDMSDTGSLLRILAADSNENVAYHTPIPQFWGIIHLLFWCGWININVGIFNAIPMVPLDGGYIMKEGVDRLFDRRGLGKYAPHIVASISWLMLFMLISIVALPYLLHL